MKAEHVVLFEQESGKLSDGTRFAVRLESWCAEVNMRTRRRYFLLSGKQTFDGSWSFGKDSQYVLLDNGNTAHLIRRAIEAYDELVGVEDG